MEFRSAARPASSLLSCVARHSQQQRFTPLTSMRGHKTTARTKRSLKIAPHDSFLPDRSAPFPSGTSIIYNPPASEASPEHTPFLFLPPSDPRRAAVARMRSTTGITSTRSSSTSSSSSSSTLAPEMRYPRRADQPRYHLSAAQVQEMRSLRTEDPLTWSVAALARRFDCSPIFVQIAAPAPKAHIEWLEEQQKRRAARWGAKKTAARDDRKRRAELMYSGEL